MPLSDGQRFAGYTILRVLGTGGMGEVYLAEHPRLPRHDALKVLGTAVSDDDEFRQRFNQEAEMVATLRHPNIVTIYDRGDFDGQLWIAMEFIDGTDAGRMLAGCAAGGLPAVDVVRIVAAIGDALDYAHSRGLLHRDIKPANILLGHSGSGGDTAELDRIMLADFGVARWLGQTSNLTGTDMTVGTVTYAAPEQLKGEEIDGHADQYALAATAFHLLTGTAPFDNTNPAVVISSHLSAPPPAIGSGHPDLARFGPVFAKALAKDPKKRYERCRDFARAMQDALASSTAGGSARHRKVGNAEAGRGRRGWVAVGLAVLLAGAALAAALVVPRRNAERSSTPTPPPPAVSSRMDLPVVVIGADCGVLGAAAVDETGAPAYCARAGAGSSETSGEPEEGSDATVWSLQPEKLRHADVSQQPPR